MNRVISVWRLLCSYVAFYKSHLEIHSRSHPGDKPFSCELCNQKFSRKSNLTRHLLTHEDIRQFQCSECDYKAMTKQHIAVHLLCHTGVKSHQCDVCDYSTTTKGQLTKHKQTHSDDKPYSCTICTCTKPNSQPVSIIIWRNMPVINILYVLNVTIRHLWRVILTDICWHTQVKGPLHVYIVPTGLGKWITLPNTQRFVNMPQSQQYELYFNEIFLFNLGVQLSSQH